MKLIKVICPLCKKEFESRYIGVVCNPCYDAYPEYRVELRVLKAHDRIPK
jgi:hypothetical protein